MRISQPSLRSQSATSTSHPEQVREGSSERGKDVVTAAERGTQPSQHTTLNGNRRQGIAGARWAFLLFILFITAWINV